MPPIYFGMTRTLSIFSLDGQKEKVLLTWATIVIIVSCVPFARQELVELKAVFKRGRRMGDKNTCKLWFEERTPEQLKGEGG